MYITPTPEPTIVRTSTPTSTQTPTVVPTVAPTPEDVAAIELSELGLIATETYRRVYNYDGWWWTDDSRLLGGDSEFTVRDFVTLVLFIELFGLYDEDAYYNAWTEALVRSHTDWASWVSQYGYETDPSTSEGILNWVFAQSGTGRRRPESFERYFRNPEGIRRARLTLDVLIDPAAAGHPEWLNGCKDLDRPCYVGSNTPENQLSYIYDYWVAGCPNYVFYGECSNPDLLGSNFAFIITRRQAMMFGR